MPYVLARFSAVVLAAILFFVPRVISAEPIRIGSISSEPAAEMKKFLPFADYLARQLRSEGIDQGKVVVAESIPQMAAFFRERRVDLYIDSPFPSVAVSRLSGSKFLLRRWKKGVAEYHTVVFARKDSGLRGLEDLKGKTIAFEEPFSTSGYYLPKMALMQAGLRLAQKSKPADRVSPQEVGYVFSYADENTMLWVLRGQVLAGATDNQNYLKEAKGNLDKLHVVHRTFSLPRHVVSYRAELAPRLVARVREVLMTMDQSEDGRKVLHDFERTTKFDGLPDQAMAPILKAQKLIDAGFGLR